MIIYFVCIFVICFFYRFLNQKNALFLSFLLLTIVASLRSYTVGIDTQQYYDSYKYIGESNWDFKNVRYEFLFCCFVKILYQISHNPQLLIITSSIIINLAFYIFAKKNANNYFIYTILYIFMNIYFSNMNIMREALAISFTLLGFEFIKKKKYFMYIFFSFASVGFHNTGIISFLILFIYLISNLKYTKICILIGGIVLFFGLNYVVIFLSKILNLTYDEYLSTKFGNGFNTGAILDLLFYLLLVFLIYFVIYNGIPSNIKISNETQINSFFTAILLFFILTLSYTLKINVFNRITIYFESFALISLTNLMSKIQYRKILSSRISLKIFLSRVILIAFFSYWLIINYLRPEWAGCSFYSFFWNI